MRTIQFSFFHLSKIVMARACAPSNILSSTYPKSSWPAHAGHPFFFLPDGKWITRIAQKGATG